MKKFYKIYADEIIIISGFIGVLAISYLYSRLNILDNSLFWSAVLPSAFVDIISIVISTILITRLINSNRIYQEKSNMYEIINVPHCRMVHKIIWEYKYLILAQPNENLKKDLNEDLDITHLRRYFNKNIRENFQSDEIFIDEIKGIPNEEGIISEEKITTHYTRVQLMENYQNETINILSDFIKEYSYVSNKDYLALLVEIKEYLKGDNPLYIYYDDECGLMPAKINIDEYIEDNQKYMDKVIKLKGYFKGIETVSQKSKNTHISIWILIGFSVLLGIITFMIIKAMGLFIGL